MDHFIECRFNGNSVTVGHATPDEITELVHLIEPGTARDRLDDWVLIAVREPQGRGVKVHALGWRAQIENTWITSALTAVSVGPAMIGTHSGHAYLLGRRGSLTPNTELWDHLIYALTTWGFSDLVNC